MDDTTFESIFPFATPRSFQRGVIEKIIDAFNSGKTHVVLCAPTGIGKSVIGTAVANYYKNTNIEQKAAYFLTAQKILQAQYEHDLKMKSIKGKANYKCRRDKTHKLKCDFGLCAINKGENKNRKNQCPDCEYYSARDEAFNANLFVTNYSYFLNMERAEFAQLTHRSLLVLDECQNAESELIEFASLKLVRNDFIKFGLNAAFLSFPAENDSEEEKFDWLFAKVEPKMLTEFEKQKILLDSMDASDIELYHQTRLCKYLDTIVCMIHRLKEEIERGVHSVVDQTDDEIYFKLVFGGPMAYDRLFQHADKVLSMSATILSKSQYCRNMCIDEKDAEWIDCPSVFKKENRLVHLCDVGSMSWKNKELTTPKLCKKVNDILNEFPNSRGIIHTVNYDLTNKIYESVSDINRERLVIPRGKTRDADIAAFMTSRREDLILLSPSLSEGIDLKDDLSRFTIVAKIPWASLADKWVKRRMDLDKEWYGEEAIISLVQMTGRSVRSEQDYAAGYILDSDFNMLFKRSFKKFPKWWKEALVTE